MTKSAQRDRRQELTTIFIPEVELRFKRAETRSEKFQSVRHPEFTRKALDRFQSITNDKWK